MFINKDLSYNRCLKNCSVADRDEAAQAYRRKGRIVWNLGIISIKSGSSLNWFGKEKNDERGTRAALL